MADSYTREQIVRKLKRLRSKHVKRGDWFHLKGFAGSSYGASLQVSALDKPIAAFPPKGSKK
jgi:hypothetical protein